MSRNQNRQNNQNIPFVKINGNSSSAILNTESLFREMSNSTASPIDIYVSRNKALLIKLGEFESAGLLDDSNEDDMHIYNLFLLGFISNVESYFRSVIRETIKIDDVSYKCCLEEPLTYAAAIHHNKELLPEALLEQCTFISKANITESLKKFLGISLNKQETSVKEVTSCLDQFEQLCQLRHCIVHRAGLLGSKNAIKLGISEHKTFFEKPINLSLSFLQNANIICLNTVRTTNNLLFNKLVARYLTERTDVAWDYRIDSKWYKKYYNIFISTILDIETQTSGNEIMSPFAIYKEFREKMST
jgi:hypothetical protein